MSRLTLALAAAVLLLGAGLAFVLVRPADSGLNEAAVRDIVNEALTAPAQPNESAIRTIVADILAERDAPPHSGDELDAATLNPMIESYLLENPSILQRVSDALRAEVRAVEMAQAKTALAAMRTQIYEDPDNVVLGNSEGDVTLVEMFDYNCGYCRSAMPDMATLLAEDPNLKVILKEFPILSKDSDDAARIGVLVRRAQADYWAFHETLFAGRGQVTLDAALKAAQELGLNPVSLRLEMGTPSVSGVIDRSHELAQALNISGTPTYIIGDEIIPGAIGIEQLRTRIANMRVCGKTACEPDPAS
ncbi:MAG: DsbA family protein [Devosia sp.]